ncbi:MAG: alanine racemase [Mariprofundaceae bacterium]|nr:alanine racemase [Mariprofundaceae bacterium]
MRPTIAYISLDNLAYNYHLLCEKSGDAEVMAVVKANAYGHGLEHVAPCLYQHGCRSFAVTDACEGAELRRLLDKDAKITLFSGIFDDDDAKLSVDYDLTPVVTEIWHINCLQQQGFQAAVWLKVNTGMNRLDTTDWQGLWECCQHAGIRIEGIMSHLACADIPEHPLNQQQVQIFQSILSKLPVQVHASLLNSAGIAALPPTSYFDVVRPGLALYGIEPIEAAPMNLKEVMCLKAKVIQIRKVQQGQSISYGASYIVGKAMNIAVVSIGYGDGLPRELSNSGLAFYENQALPIIGRVCMDYCLLNCSESDIQTGDEVIFWGEGHSVSSLAKQLNTIPYTLTTGLQSRVKRKAIQV